MLENTIEGLGLGLGGNMPNFESEQVFLGWVVGTEHRLPGGHSAAGFPTIVSAVYVHVWAPFSGLSLPNTTLRGTPNGGTLTQQINKNLACT